MRFDCASDPSRRRLLAGATGLAASTLAIGGCSGVPGLSGSYTFSLGLTAVAHGVRYSTRSVYSVGAFYNDPLNPGEPWATGQLRGRSLVIDAGAGGTLFTTLAVSSALLPYPTLITSIELIPFLLPLAYDPTVVPATTDLSRFERRNIAWKQERILLTRPLSLLAATRRLPPDTPIPYNLYPAFVWLPVGSTVASFRLFDRPHLEEATDGAYSSVEMDISPARGKPNLRLPDAPWVNELKAGRSSPGLELGAFVTIVRGENL